VQVVLVCFQDAVKLLPVFVAQCCFVEVGLLVEEQVENL